MPSENPSSIVLFRPSDPTRAQSARMKSYMQLPNDVVREIFLRGFLDRNGDFERTFPLVVSLVCSRWRTVALSTSLLWSNIPIIIARHYGLSLVETYLVRSRLQPLAIGTLDRSNDMDAETEAELAAPIVQALLPHIGRWQKLTLWPKHPSTVQTMLSLLTGEASNLLDLRIGNGDGKDCHHPDMYKFGNVLPQSFRAPRLACIELFDYPHVWNETSLGCVASLETLRIHQEDQRLQPPNIQDLIPVLLSQPKLQCLTLAGAGETDSDPPWDEYLCLPNLGSVILENASVEVLMDFFSTFMAPELTTMSFENIFPSEDPFELPSILDECHDCFPRLHHFSLAGCGDLLAATILAPHFITSVTLHICNIETESVWDERTSDAIFTFMSRPFCEDWWLCPALQSLEVFGSKTDTTATLRSLVQGRLDASSDGLSDSPCAIQTLRVVGLSISQADREWLFENVENFTIVEDAKLVNNV